MAYKMKMYDPSGKLVEVNRNQQDELLGQGYSFMGPKTTTANTQTVNYVKPEGGYPAIRGDAGGIGYSARRDFEGMINQEPGYEGGYLDGFNSVEEMQKFYGLAPEIDPYADMMNQFRAEQQRLAEAQRQSRISGLKSARDSALSGLEGEKATIDPYYYDKRNQAAGASDVSAMNFAQYMAGRGIKGSAGAMPEIYRNAALQSQIGALDKQQAAEHADIARRKSEIESAYQSDVAGANADIDAQTMQNYINQMTTLQAQREAQRIADLNAQGLTSTGQLTLQGRNAQNAEYERQAALLAAQYYDDIQAYIDTLDPNDPRIPYLHAARREKINTQAEQKAAAMAAASEAEQQAWNNAFKLFQQTGRITSPEQAQILGLPTNATVADVDIARMNAATSQMNAYTQAANLDYKKQQDLLAQSSQKVKQYASQIDNLFMTNQFNDNSQVTGKSFDPVAVKAYIQNLNTTGQINDDEARQLLALYNFTY